MEVTGYTAERMKAIEDASIVNGEVDVPTGHLTLIRFDGTEIDAGQVTIVDEVSRARIWRPADAAALAALTGLRLGDRATQQDTGRTYQWTGSAWRWESSPHNEANDFVAKTPTGNSDASAASLTAWGMTDALTVVPPWATVAQVGICVSGAYPATAFDGLYAFQLRIGTDQGREVTHDAGGSASGRRSIVWQDEVSLTSTGSKTVQIFQRKGGGSGVMRIDTASDVSYIIKYLP